MIIHGFFVVIFSFPLLTMVLSMVIYIVEKIVFSLYRFCNNKSISVNKSYIYIYLFYLLVLELCLHI